MSASLLALQRQAGNRAVASSLPVASARPSKGLVARCAGGGCGCTGDEHDVVTRKTSPAPPVVRRAVAVQREYSRDELLAALRKSIAAGDWVDVARRLNGFDEADIARLSQGLSVAQAASARAAVEEHRGELGAYTTIVAGLEKGRAQVARLGAAIRAFEDAAAASNWPEAVTALAQVGEADAVRLLKPLTWQQKMDLRAAAGDNPKIEAAIEKSEAVRVSAVFAAYDAAVRAANWDTAVRQLNGMSQPDIQSRLAALDDAQVHAMRSAATSLPGNAQTMLVSEVNRRKGQNAEGEPADAGAGGPGSGPALSLLVGGRYLADGTFVKGGSARFDVAKLLDRGAGAKVGTEEVAAEEVVVLEAKTGAAEGASTATAEAAGTGAVESAAAGAETAATGASAGAGGAAPAAPALGLVGTFTVMAGAVAGAAFVIGTPLIIAHARAVAEQFPEFGPGSQPGTMLSPPGGALSPEQLRRTRCGCPPGTNERGGGLDGQGRAAGSDATIGMPPSVGQPPWDDPAGWAAARRLIPRPVRAHLLPAGLGGNGGRGNLVPLSGGRNTKEYYGYEIQVYKHLEANPGTCVRWLATPIYGGPEGLPSGIEISAMDLCTREFVTSGQIYNEFNPLF
jgi:hypothetical protein